MILNQTMNETADAIREKTGKSELIKPVDFATEIKGISVGGGESGGNKVVYLNVIPIRDAMGDMFGFALSSIAGLLAVKVRGEWVTICPLSYLDESYISNISSIAVLSDFRGLVESSNDINSSLIIQTLIEQGATEITKEQFYDLNA